MITDPHSLLSKDGDTTVHEHGLEQIDGVLLVFDQPEGVGKVVIERGSYGLYIHVNGRCLALIDLYAYSPEFKERAHPDKPLDYPQIIFYTGDDEDDPLGHIRWLPDETEILINSIDVREQIAPWHSTYTINHASHEQESHKQEQSQ